MLNRTVKCLHSLHNVFFPSVVAVKSPSQVRKTITTTDSNERQGKEPFHISKVTVVRPDNLIIPSLVKNDNSCGVEGESVRSVRLKVVLNSTTQETASEVNNKEMSGVEPVRRLPRSSGLIRLERQRSLSKENISSSTDSLNEGGQKKARLKIPKPSKLLSVKSRVEDKEKKRKEKEDANNNCKLQ